MIKTLFQRIRRVLGLQSRMQLLMGLTLALVCAFGVTAWRTARVERAKVSLTICFLAADASRVLQGRSRLYLGTVTDPIFAAVGGRAPLMAGVALPAPGVLRQADMAIARCHCAPRLSVRAYFRLNVEPDGTAGKLLIEFPDSGVAPGAGSTASAMKAAVPAAQSAGRDTAMLKEAVLRVIPEMREEGVVAAAVTGTASDSDALRAVAVVSPKFDTDGRLRAVYGLVVTPIDFATEVIGRVFDRVPLFSKSLVDSSYHRRAMVWGQEQKAANRGIANLAVLDTRQTPLYQTGPMADTASTAPGCVGMTRPEAGLAFIMLHVSPPLPVFDQWTADSMATSQLPFLGAITVGMLLCVGAAAVAARREADLARLRSDFVSSISHELRMPLAQILISGETLSLGRTRSQAERDDAADAIVREAQRLTGLVDNALFFSRIEHHNVRVMLRPVELSQLVDETAMGVARIAQGAEATVANNVPHGLYAMLDCGAFRQVLYNLLENAIKYGPLGQTVVVGAAPSGASPDRVRIWVEDEGPGIPKRYESRIFEPFVRLERETSMHVTGSGLGLSVVKYIVSRHDGHVWIERGRRRTGSRFVVDVARVDLSAIADAGLHGEEHGRPSESHCDTGD